MRELAGADLAAAPQDAPLATPEELDREQRRAAAAGRSDLGNAFNAGIEDIKASGYTARGLLRIGVGDEQGGVADVQHARDISDKASEFQRGPQSYSDVHSLGDAAGYVGNSLARLAPQIGLGVLTGGTGGLVEGGAAAALRTGLTRAAIDNVVGRRAIARGATEAVASRGLQQRAARRVAAKLGDDFVTKRVKAGAAKGALGSSVVQQTALAQDTVLDQDSPDSLRERALKAGVGSVVTGAIDALPIVHLLGRYGIGDVAKKAVEGGIAKRVLHHAVRQGLEEGSTELAQAVGEQATHKWVNDNVDLLGPDAVSDYINSAAMGFIGGGAFGAPGGIRGAKLSSDAGKKWAASFRDYTSKLRPQRKPTEPAPGAPEPAKHDPLDTGVDLGEIAANLKRAAPAAREFTGKIDAAMTDVGEKAENLFDGFLDDNATEASIQEVLDATPIEYKNTSYGTQLFNQGNGVDFAKALIPPGRIAELRTQFPDMHPFHAAAMAMIPDKLKAGEFNNDGTLAEVTKLLRGEDPANVDNAKVSAFQEALPPENRGAFNRYAHTSFLASQTPDFNADIPDENAAVKGNGSEVAGQATESDDLSFGERRATNPDAPLATIPARQLGIGAVVNKKAPLGDNEIALSKADKNGRATVRRMSGESIGNLIRTLREQDQDFARLSQREQVVGALNELAQRGHNIDPKTLPRGLKLGNNWFVAPAQMAAIKNGWAPTQAPKATAPTQRAATTGARTADEESALNKEFGKGDVGRVLAREPRFDPEAGRVDEVGDEARAQGDPVVRAPAQAPVQGTRAALIGQGVDTRARRVGKLQVATDAARENLDRLIAGVTQHSTDAAVDLSSNEGRLEAFRLARRMAGPVERGRLEEAAAAYKAARIAEREGLKAKKTDKVQTPDTARITITPEEAVDRGKVDVKALKEERAAEREPVEQEKNSIEYLDAQEKVRLGQLERAKKANNQSAMEKHRKALYAIRKTRAELYPKSDKKSEPRTSLDARLKARLRNNIAQDDAKKVAVRKAARGAVEEKVPNVADRTLGKEASKANRRTQRIARRAQEIDREPAALPDIAPGTTTLTAKSPTTSVERAIEEGPFFDAVKLAGQINIAAGKRSRRELFDLSNRIAASNINETVKAKLLVRVREQVHALNESAHAAGLLQQMETSLRTSPAAHYNASRAALRGAASLIDGLERLRPHMTEQQRVLLDALAKLGSLKGIPLTVDLTGTSVTFGRRIPNGSGSAAFISDAQAGKTLTGSVVIDLAANEAAVESIDIPGMLLHEAMHAATSHAEQNNRVARAELIKLLDYARAEAAKLGVNPDAFYGLSETQEFLAEAFTQPQLQALLRAIKMPADPDAPTAAPRTARDAFVDSVTKVLGREAKTPDEAVAQRDVLDAIFEQGLALARETGDARNAAFAEVFGQGDTVSTNSIDSIESSPASGSQPTDYMSLLSPQNRANLEATLRRGDIYRQVRDTMPADLQRVLDSANQGPSLLVNTGLALALQGKLNLSPDSKGFVAAVQALWDTISKVLQVPSKGAYGREIIRQIKTGTDAKNVNAETALLTPAAQRVHAYVNQRIRPVVASLLRDMDSRMRSTGVPALTQLATLLSQRTGEFRADNEVSLSARTLKVRNEYLNKAFDIIGTWDADTKLRVLKELQEKREKVSPEAAQLRGFYKDMYAYLRLAGLPVKETQDYFPVSISPEAILAKPEAFLGLLDNFSEPIRAREIAPLREQQRAIKKDITKRAKTTGEPAAATDEEREALSRLAHQIAALNKATPRELSQRVMDYAVKRSGDSHVGNMTFSDGDHNPVFRALNARVMDYIYEQGTPEQIATFATFQDQSLERTTVHYVNRATRRAEWSRAQLDTRVPKLLEQAEEQGATPQQLQMARDHVDMMMGAYGADYNPYIKKIAETLGVNLPPFEKWQKLQAALTTYQNLRLLPLAAMSSLIDPLGIAVRGGELRGSFDAYKKAVAAMRDKQGDDSLRRLAHNMGIIERHAVSEALVHLYGSINDPTGRAAKLNSVLFRFNGLEYITKFSRLAALASANNFLIYHAGQKDAQSLRYLTELGLTPKDVKAGADGYVIRSEKIDAALNRFVNEAVVRPTPGQRPGWQNDPNFQLAAQYKGYLYSFFNTITRRALHEVDKGNLAVLLPLLMYLPVTAIGEMLRDFLQRDGKSKDTFDYAKLSVSRSGLLGPQLGSLVDTRSNWMHGHAVLNTVGGPTGQQLGRLYDTATGNGWQTPGEQVETALPGSALYKEWN
jgi:hypothetical protein